MRIAVCVGLSAWIWHLGVTPAGAVVLGTVDTFQDGTMQGWDGGSDAVMLTDGPGGPGDSFLRASSGTFAEPPHLAIFSEQARWVGNYTAAGAATLSADVKVLEGSALELRAVVFGGTTQSSRATSTTTVPVPADGQWHRVTFDITAASLTLVYPFDSMADVLEKVNRVMLRHQSGLPDPSGTPISARVGFDNISVTPEPGALLLCLFGTGLMFAHRQRA